MKSDRPDPDSSRTRSLSSSNTTQVDNEGSCHIPKSELEQGDEFDCEVPQTDSADCHEDQRKNWDDTSPARYAHRSLSKDPSTCDTEVKIPYLDGTEAVDGEARNKVSVRTDKQTDDKYINGRLRTVGAWLNFSSHGISVRCRPCFGLTLVVSDSKEPIPTFWNHTSTHRG